MTRKKGHQEKDQEKGSTRKKGRKPFRVPTSAEGALGDASTRKKGRKPATPTPTTTDRFQYSYDQDGDVLYSDNLVNAAESQLYHSNSTTSGDDNTAYDPLARLTDFARGTLSASGNNGSTLDTVASPSETQNFALDAVGNQASVTTNGTTVDNTANSKNELTANGANDLAFDNNGNTVTDQSGNTYKLDAWTSYIENLSFRVDPTYARRGGCRFGGTCITAFPLAA